MESYCKSGRGLHHTIQLNSGNTSHLTLNPGHPIGHPGLTPTTHATTASQLSLLSGVQRLYCNATALSDTLDARTSSILLLGGELPTGARCSGQGETGCAGSLQSLKERCIRNQLPASAAPAVFLRRVILQPSSEVVGEALPAAGGRNREASSEGQRVVGGRCLLE